WLIRRGLVLSMPKRTKLSRLLLLAFLIAVCFLTAKANRMEISQSPDQLFNLKSVLISNTSSSKAVDFQLHIRPIFERHCTLCHNPEKRRGGLLLTNSKYALQAADSGMPAIVPGKSGLSEVIKRVRASDKEKRMPPGDHSLSTEDIALLE